MRSDRSVPDPEDLYAALLTAVRAGLTRGAPPCVVGVHTGGVWVAERLHRDLGLSTPIGALSSTFHRDDHAERGIPATIQGTQIGFDVVGQRILLVDDILHTGRTVRAALNEIFDYGRPASIELAVLVDRGGRELPVRADYLGGTHLLTPEERFVLRAGPGPFTLAILANSGS